MEEEFISDFHFLEMKHFVISVKLDRRLFSHHVTCKIVHEGIDNVVMDLPDRKRNEFINGEPD